MTNSTTDNANYCKELVKKLDYPRYLQCAFATEYFPLFALNCELRHVHHAVSEEMIGHIRYAWWAESVETLAREHPVLQALKWANYPTENLLTLVNHYREAYPEQPQHTDVVLNSILSLPAKDKARFDKAGQVITNHQGGRLTLLVKLLFV